MKFNKILLLQNNMLGDVIISTGFVKAVRDKFPNSKIAFLVQPATADLVRLPFIDEVIPYDKGMPLLPVIKKVWRYDVALCLDFKYRSAVIPFFARIPVRAGISHKRKIFLTDSVPITDNFSYESKNVYYNQFMALVMEKCIGLKLDGDLTRLYIADSTKETKAAVDKVLPVSDYPTIAIAPFSSTLMKNYPPERYKIFIEKLRENFACRFVVIGGKSDVQKDFYIFEGDVDLRGKLSLTESAEVLRRADYFIGSCSAPLHMASAVGTPALALYGPTSPQIWAPRHKCIYIQHKQDCSPCDRVGYGVPCNGDNICIKSISVEEVLSAFENLRQKYPIN